MTDEQLAQYDGPSLPWRTGLPSASEVEMWARTYPDSPGVAQPNRYHPGPSMEDRRHDGPIPAGRWLVHSPAEVSPLGDVVRSTTVLGVIEGRVYLRNGFSFWQPLDGTMWAARSKFLPCRRDGIPIALLRRVALVDRVLDPAVASSMSDGSDLLGLMGKAGALAEIAREVDAALARMPNPNGAPTDPSIGGKSVLDRLGLVILQRDRAWEELDRRYLARESGIEANVHREGEDCPTYYDGCNCTVDALVGNIDRANRAEAALRAAGLPIPKAPTVEEIPAHGDLCFCVDCLGSDADTPKSED